MANKEFSVKSLCLISKGESGYYLARLADIIGKNRLVAFTQNENESKNFSNRNLWFMTEQNLPVGLSVGFVGIWNLTSIPNINVSTKDYIKTSYSSTDIPIEILYFKEANTCSEIIQKLKTGVVFKPICRKILFCYSPKRDIFQGILVSIENLNIKNNNITTLITTDLTSLPVYLINVGLYNLLSFKQIPNKMFYNSLDLGEEIDRVLVKSEMEIIREIIIKRASWPVMKQKGFSKNDWKIYRDFINVINDNDFYEEIAINCNCSENMAKSKVNDFINNCDNFVEGKDFDTEVIASVLKRNTQLNTICMREAATFWEKDHQEKVEKANNELKNIQIKAAEIRTKALANAESEIKQEKDRIKNEEKRIQELLNNVNIKEKEIKDKEELLKKKIIDYQKEEEKIKKAISEQMKKLEKLEIECSEKAKLGEEVKSKIVDRIKEAKQDIASFMSEYTFLNNIIANAPNNISNINKNETNNHLYFKNSEIIKEEVTKYSELIEYLKENLLSAGVDEDQANGFATFLFVL